MSVASDQPITKAAEDRFGRSEFAARIAGVISSLEDTNSVVISVNAPWGEGKTSILNLIEEELLRLGNTVVVRFNPWRFPDEERLLLGFFKTLAGRLKVDLKKVSKKIGEGFKDILAAFQIPFVSSSGVKALAESWFPRADVEDAKKRISEALLSSPKKIVIFLDDIDRLDSKEIQAVFRLVKLTADFPNTAYVLAFDDAIVSAAVAEQFSNEQQAGSRFVEKIVQVPLTVPPVDHQVMRKMAFEGVEAALRLAGVELTLEEAKHFVMVFDRSFTRMLASPRAVKRYTNMLNFAIPILKGEANVLDLIFIEAVRAFFPKVYKAIWAYSDLFLRDSLEIRLSFSKDADKQQFHEVTQTALAGLQKKEVEGALFVVRVLFPETREYGLGLFGHHDIDSGESAEAGKRLCSGEYFRRYFTYGIPPNDVSDRKVEALINDLARSDVDQIMIAIQSLSDVGRTSVLIQKLRLYADKIPAGSAERLVIAIARRSALIADSHPEDNFFGLGSLSQAAFLLRVLIGRIQDPIERDRIAKEVANSIERLPLGYEFCDRVRKLRKEEGSIEYDAVVSDECEREIFRIFADKLSLAAELSALEDEYPLFKRGFYIHWRWHNQQSLQEYAERRLSANASDVGKFLNAVLGITDRENKSGFLHLPNHDDEYRFLGDIVRPDRMMEFIRKAFGDTNAGQLPLVVAWFIRMYQRAGSADSTEHAASDVE